MVSERKIKKYLDAKRELDALLIADEQEISSPERTRMIAAARIVAKLAYARLTGSEIGKLRIILAAKA